MIKTLRLFILLQVTWEQSRSWKWENQLALVFLTLFGAVSFGMPQWQANPLGMSELKKLNGHAYLTN